MKKIIQYLFLLITTLAFIHVHAQTTLLKRHKIALFIPLYLDSAFDATTLEYKQGKQFPKYITAGLEFYEGAQLALDSLEKEGAPLEVSIYDTKSDRSISEITSTPGFAGTELIIGHVISPNEVRMLAQIAQTKNIPFINANLPNDGGVTKNPFLVILNSTLYTHCQGIYKFLQKNYATARLVVFQKKGSQENILRSYFNDIEKNTASVSLKLKFVTLEDDFTSQNLIPYLDSTEITMCVGASLDEHFARSLSQQLALLNNQYPVQLTGMPTWDVIPFEKKEYMGLEIFYSTPFYVDRNNKISNEITNHFKSTLYARPSDMVFRGYECLYHFGKLLIEHGANLSSSIGEKKYNVFNELNIQPVFLSKPTQSIDYFENKKLYFLKKVNGEIKEKY